MPVDDVAHIALKAMNNIEFTFEQRSEGRVGECFRFDEESLGFLHRRFPFWRCYNVDSVETRRIARNVIDYPFLFSVFSASLEEGDIDGIRHEIEEVTGEYLVATVNIPEPRAKERDFHVGIRIVSKRETALLRYRRRRYG